MITVDDKIKNINDSLEEIRDIMLGLDTSLAPYTLDENNIFDKEKILKLVDTLLFYIMQENPLYNKNDLKFYRYCLTSMLFFSSNIEALPLENINFKMLLATADIIDSDPETYSELVVNAYFTMKPNFMLANLDGIDDISNITEEDLANAKLTAATKKQEEAIRKEWEKDHLNSQFAEEILSYDQKFLENYDAIPDDFYPVIEKVIYKFLNDEGKGFYDDKYLTKIRKSLLTAIEKNSTK